MPVTTSITGSRHGWTGVSGRPSHGLSTLFEVLTANAEESRDSKHDSARVLARRARQVAANYPTRKRGHSKWSLEKGVTAPAPAPYLPLA